MAKTETASGSQAVERAMLLLGLVVEADEPQTIPDLVAATGLNRTTVWRLLAALESHGYVARIPGYVAGPAALRLGQVGAKRFGPLVRPALPIMQALADATGETVTLAVPHDRGTMTVAQLDSPQTVRLRNYLYEVSPLACSSTGRALLSTYPPTEAAAIAGTAAVAVEQARQLGYATVVEDLAPGENGLAAPVMLAGQAIALLSVAGPSSRLTPSVMAATAPRLKAACAELEALLA